MSVPLTKRQPVSFGEKLASSQAFADLFRDGMALVEETAAYLDGPGRQESKKLERSAALAYATESMRLTTRLMQLASWLLLHRAVKEGEMSLAQANKEKTKVKLAAGEPGDPDNDQAAAGALRDLIDRSQEAAATRCAGSTPTSMRRRSRRTSRGSAIRWSASWACSRPRSSSDARSLQATARQQKTPAQAGVFVCRAMPAAYFFAAVLDEAGELLLEARQRPPRSISCCWPPVQAGCDFGSMSRCSVSPSLPQVVRVVNSVPSVIMTLMV